MEVTVSRISPVKMELSVEVPADTVRAEVDKAYLNLSKRAHIRGFRPGKAPRAVLVQLYEPQVKSDVANSIVNTTLNKALTDKNVMPVSQPMVEAGNIDPKAKFSYKATFEVSPDINDVKYEGFELKRPKREVTDAMVDEQIEQIQKATATLKAPEPARASKEGDVVTIDFTLMVDGEEVKDGGGNGVQIELGSKQVLPELDAGLTGKKVGDKATIEATFGKDHPRKDFREKKGTFHVTVSEIKEKVLAALDDEFAKDTGLGQTMIELRAQVHTQLEKGIKDQTDLAVAEQIIQQLNDANPCEVPPSLIDQQTRMMEQEVVMQARRFGQRLTQEMFEGMRPKIREDAEKKVRAGLIMAAIARKLEIKVTEEDIEKGIQELAQEMGKNPSKVRAEYREKQKRDVLVGMILEDKILDILESKSKISDVDPSELEKKDDDKTEAKPKKEPKGKK